MISGIPGCPPSPPRRRSANGLYMNTIQAQLRDQHRGAQQFVPNQGFRCLRSCPNTPANGVSNAGSDILSTQDGLLAAFLDEFYLTGYPAMTNSGAVAPDCQSTGGECHPAPNPEFAVRKCDSSSRLPRRGEKGRRDKLPHFQGANFRVGGWVTFAAL